MYALILILIVGLGGGIGTALRYVTSHLFKKHVPTHHHFATLSVNTIGCFFIGFFYIFFVAHVSIMLNELIITGILGGLTTFSSFTLDNVKLIEQKRYKDLLIYFFTTLIFGGVALIIGIYLATLWFR